MTPGPYSIGMLADDAVGLLDALGIRQAHIMGLSMGGMIAQQIGARYPDRALSLLLCDTASEMPPRTMWEERLAIARSQGISDWSMARLNAGLQLLSSNAPRRKLQKCGR